MRKHLVMTVSGNDRVGIVERITKMVLDYEGNIESSRMARLGGEFVIVMLVSLSKNKFGGMREQTRSLREEGYKVVTKETKRGYSAKYEGWLPYQVKVNGADHEGIIYEITKYLADHNINIETMDTSMSLAPMSGTPLFRMTAVVIVPPDVSFAEWRDDMEDIGDQLNVDVEVDPYTG